MYVLSGKSHSLFLDILPGETECFLFAKTPWSCRGSVGICTYLVQGTDNRLAIYYSNPFIGHNGYGLGWIAASDNLDTSSYHKHFTEANTWVVRGNMKNRKVTSSDGMFVARAFMTQGEHVKMDVNIFEQK